MSIIEEEKVSEDSEDYEEEIKNTNNKWLLLQTKPKTKKQHKTI